MAKNYDKDQHNKISEMFQIVIDSLEVMQDFLGSVFSSNDMGNSHKGQFFTPYHVSKMMSKINGINLKIDLEEKKFITMCEPCCGSGGMIIAFAECMKEEGFNYQHQLYVEATDVDDMCFKMTYVQLALLGIPAKVICGDSLSLKTYEVLYTPMFFINGFYRKLSKYQENISEKEIKSPIIEDIEVKEIKKEEVVKEIMLTKKIQLRLFE